MKKIVCSIYDHKAKVFCVPFFSVNNETAQRDFGYAANDPKTEIGRYPTDFTLFRLGTYDDETAGFDLEPHSNLGIAANFVGELNV